MTKPAWKSATKILWLHNLTTSATASVLNNNYLSELNIRFGPEMVSQYLHENKEKT